MRLPKQLPSAERKRNRCAVIPAGANVRPAQWWRDVLVYTVEPQHVRGNGSIYPVLGRQGWMAAYACCPVSSGSASMPSGGCIPCRPATPIAAPVDFGGMVAFTRY